jgi:large subunit ribosomal protein L25
MLQTRTRSKSLGKPAQLRRAGQVPIALVGRDHKTTSLVASLEEFKTALAGADGHGRIDLSVDGESKQAVLKKLEHDVLKRSVLNVVLFEAGDSDVVKLDVSVVPVGHSEDTEAKEVNLTQVADHLTLRGKLSSLPERIEVNVADLHVGQHVSASDVSLPEGVVLVSAPDTVLFTVQVIEEPDLSPQIPPEEAHTLAPGHDSKPEGGADGGDEPSS